MSMDVSSAGHHRRLVDVARPGAVVGAAQVAGGEVLHHGFDAVTLKCASELFTMGFDTLDYRHRHPLFGELSVDIQHSKNFFFGFFLKPLESDSFRVAWAKKGRVRSKAELSFICLFSKSFYYFSNGS